jgi:hypothetical protein
MSSHFLLSAKARTLSLSAVLRMTDEEAETAFCRIRWGASDGKPVCPNCGCEIVYNCRKANGAPRWRCKACRKDFSVTSGTLFAFHKMPLRTYLAAIAIFCNEVKGKSALAPVPRSGLPVQDGVRPGAQDARGMASEMKGKMVGGVGKVVETDGAYFGGYVKPANMKENRRDRRLARNQTGKRQVVVVVRERDGRTLPAVFRSESAALGFITSRVAKGTKLMADEAGSWNDLHARFDMARIDHGQVYSRPGGVYTNGAEEFFSRMRRAEIGHHHHIAGAYLIRYAQEAAWREDHRRMDNGRQVQGVMRLAMAAPVSVDWCGYWQR